MFYKVYASYINIFLNNNMNQKILNTIVFIQYVSELEQILSTHLSHSFINGAYSTNS